VKEGQEPPPWGPAASRDIPAWTPRGLCPDCVHVRRIESAKGSVFWMCELSKQDERFPRYPVQPRMACPGFQR
jgi:hypothetical protein